MINNFINCYLYAHIQVCTHAYVFNVYLFVLSLCMYTY